MLHDLVVVMQDVIGGETYHFFRQRAPESFTEAIGYVFNHRLITPQAGYDLTGAEVINCPVPKTQYKLLYQLIDSIRWD